MLSIDEVLQDEEVKKEYHNTVLLSLFKRFCYNRRKDDKYSNRIYKLYRESKDARITTKAIMEDEFSIKLNDGDCELMTSWIIANERKSNRRKKLDNDLKQALLKKQQGVCSICGDTLPTDYSKINIDHIVPFELVGDELSDNYQCLCEHCNKSKSSKIDYVLLRKLNIR